MQNLEFNLNVAQQDHKLRFAFSDDKPNHVTVKQALLSGALYEPDVSALMIRALRQGDTFIDIGANQGYFSVLAGVLIGPEGRVVSVEPGDNNIEDLKRNMALNGLTNGTLVTQPLSDVEKPVNFYLNADDSGGNALWDPAHWASNHKSQANPQSVRLQATTLNQVLQQLPGGVRLIKVDTEGAETLILRGGAQQLSRMDVPYVVAELHEFGLNQLGSSQMELRGLMKGLGYDCHVLGLRGTLPRWIPETTTIRSTYICNLLFAKPGRLGEIYPTATLDLRAF